MATFTDSDKVKLDQLYKKAGGKAYGSTAFLRPSEPLPSNLTVDAKRVFLDIPPATPPAATTATVKKHWPVEEGGDGWIVLSRDRSVADGSKWVALPEHNPAFSAGAASQEQIDSILTGFIATKYGNGYLEMFYDGTNSWIPGQGDALPTLDPDSGVVTFASGRSETGNTPQDSIKMKAFRNIGRTLADLQTAEPEVVDLLPFYIAKRDAE